ncbi:hypothetical protein GGR57DRAFT_501188 [Xylariaceae sp. FL1272]|nr:hypothetical protein GGR57DRAFT_501188 [Xylariaceae sp. FL1272]
MAYRKDLSDPDELFFTAGSPSQSAKYPEPLSPSYESTNEHTYAHKAVQTGEDTHQHHRSSHDEAGNEANRTRSGAHARSRALTSAEAQQITQRRQRFAAEQEDLERANEFRRQIPITRDGQPLLSRYASCSTRDLVAAEQRERERINRFFKRPFQDDGKDTVLIEFTHADCRAHEGFCRREIESAWAPPLLFPYDGLMPDVRRKRPESEIEGGESPFKFLIDECGGHVRGWNDDETLSTPKTVCQTLEKEGRANKFPFYEKTKKAVFENLRLHAAAWLRRWHHGTDVAAMGPIEFVSIQVVWDRTRRHMSDDNYEVNHSDEITLGHLILGRYRGMIERIDVKFRCSHARKDAGDCTVL